MLNVSCLAVAVGDEAPTAIRLFKCGANETVKGTFVFDAQAAASVLSFQAKHDVDVMLDLEHLSLDKKSPNYDPNARGWGRLAVKDGELWLVDITWTPDGARRLSEKTQRYVSPAFASDPKTGRVVRILNVAITALPATDGAQALVAASSVVEELVMKEQICRMLNMAPETPDEEVIKALAAKLAPPSEDAMKQQQGYQMMHASCVKHLSLTAEASAEEIDAALIGLSTAKGTVGELSAKCSTLQQQLDARDTKDLVRDNSAKIPPSLEVWALSQSPAALKAFLAAAPEVVAAAKTEPAKPAADPNAVTLTAEELAVIKLTGDSAESFLKFKRERASRSAA